MCIMFIYDTCPTLVKYECDLQDIIRTFVNQTNTKIQSNPTPSLILHPYNSRPNVQGNLVLKSQNLPHFQLVCTIIHYSFKLGSPNLDQRWKVAWLRSLLFWVAINLDLKGQIWFKKSNFLVSPLLETHNHHITTIEPWVPRLLHRPDCPMVSILCAYLYT